MVVQSQLTRPFCHVLAVMFWPPCLSFLAVLSWLSYKGVQSQLTCPCRHIVVVLSWLSCSDHMLFCPDCPVPTVLSRLSCLHGSSWAFTFLWWASMALGWALMPQGRAFTSILSLVHSARVSLYGFNVSVRNSSVSIHVSRMHIHSSRVSLCTSRASHHGLGWAFTALWWASISTSELPERRQDTLGTTWDKYSWIYCKKYKRKKSREYIRPMIERDGIGALSKNVTNSKKYDEIITVE